MDTPTIDENKEITAGNVEIKLMTATGEETHTLRCRIPAWRAINKHFGGMVRALNDIRACDTSAYVAVLAAALDKPAKDVEPYVHHTGMIDLMAPITDYLMRICNGGRKSDDSKPVAAQA